MRELSKHLILLIVFGVSSQVIWNQQVLSFKSKRDRTSETGIPNERAIYQNQIGSHEELFIHHTFSLKCNSFAIGWESLNPLDLASSFHIEYRYKDTHNLWTSWNHIHGELMPDQSPSGIYWASVIITDYLVPVNELEVKISAPNENLIHNVTLDGSYIAPSVNSIPHTSTRASNCPAQPTILPRSAWWGSLPADEMSYPNPTNSKTVQYNTNTTHGFIHHGASTNNYTDGAAIVRIYWNHHVNTNGWKDIGYNYLVDKFGNIYMGRHNPDFPNRDVLGAHTGVCNPYSFAICCVGDFTTSPLNSTMLNRINALMAYKCDLRGMNPVGTGFIYSATIDIISGHRVAPGASTTCPGDSAFNQIAQIRTKVKHILDSCAGLNVPISDTIPPTTAISYSGSWETTDFTASFQDNDAGSGVKNKLLNVSYLDTNWKANTTNGYFSDEFDQLNTNWVVSTGTWQTASGKLKQTDQGSANTNIYAPLDHTVSNRYLYHWKGTITGSGNNKRAGLHFMCSNPSQTERGDAYMVYFRVDNSKIEIYKSVGNTLYLKTDTPYVFNAGIEYDYKVLLDKSSGVLDVYINDKLEATFTDPWPFSTGNYISFRTGNCVYEVDKIDVYRERSNSQYISVGAGKDIGAQNPSPSIASGKIKAIAIDSTKNISAIVNQYVDIDWTKPDIQVIYDGTTLGSDEDTTNITTNIEGNWISNDVNSGILKYYFAVGDAPGFTNLIGYTDIGLVTQYNAATTLAVNNTYYITIKALNNAGLDSTLTSDGLYVKGPVGISELNKTIVNSKLYPNPANGQFTVQFSSLKQGVGSIELLDSKGAIVFTQKVSISEGENKHYLAPQLTKGLYFVKLNTGNSQVLLGVQGVE